MDCTTSPKPARPINVSIGLRPLDGCHSQPGDARTISRDLNDQYGSRGSLPTSCVDSRLSQSRRVDLTFNDWADPQGLLAPPVSPFIYIFFSAMREGWMLSHQGDNGSRISDIAAVADLAEEPDEERPPTSSAHLRRGRVCS
jgi:hypothetical protein